MHRAVRLIGKLTEYRNTGDHGRYALVLYVKNLFDTLGYDAAAGGSFVAAAAGTGRAAFAQSYDLTPPRQFGAELHYKF